MDRELFIHAASHDLQEPLRMISSYSTLLERRLEGNLDPKSAEYLRILGHNARRVNELLQELLQYAQSGAEVEAVAIHAEEPLQEAIGQLRRAIEESGAVVTYNSLPEVCATRPDLIHVFQNLLSNALKYRREGVPPKIVVSAVGPVITVQDNGIGFEPQYAERIFEMFSRLHSHVDYPGNGIGLALCDRIVRRLGGRLWAESKPGEGSRFSFMLPSPRATQT